MKSPFFILAILLAVRFTFAVPAMQTPAEIRSAYETMENMVSNLCEKAESGDRRALLFAIHSAGYIRSTNAVPFLFRHLDYKYDALVRRRRRTWAAPSPLWIPPSWSAGALNHIGFSWEEFLAYADAEPSSPARAECFAWLGLRNFPNRFSEDFLRNSAASNSFWADVSNAIPFVVETPNFSRANLRGDAHPTISYCYDTMESNLSNLLQRACTERNEANLREIVETYGFIHAPIFETVLTNAFFKAVIGEKRK